MKESWAELLNKTNFYFFLPKIVKNQGFSAATEFSTSKEEL